LRATSLASFTLVAATRREGRVIVHAVRTGVATTTRSCALRRAPRAPGAGVLNATAAVAGVRTAATPIAAFPAGEIGLDRLHGCAV